MVFVVCDRELATDDLTDACTSPDLAPKTVCLGSVCQELWNHLQLVWSQLWCRPEMGAGTQGFFSFLGHARHPLADRAFGHLQSFGNLVVCPAVALEIE